MALFNWSIQFSMMMRQQTALILLFFVQLLMTVLADGWEKAYILLMNFPDVHNSIQGNLRHAAGLFIYILTDYIGESIMLLNAQMQHLRRIISAASLKNMTR